MTRDYRPMPGTPVEKLDTPCFILDLDALDHNMQIMTDYYRDKFCKLRPHTKNHKTPALAHRQIRMGGTVGGVCTQTLTEAEVMVEGGVPYVVITNNIVTRPKIDRLCALSRQGEIMVLCDDPRNARDLSAGAQEVGVTLGVLIEVEVGNDRCGVQSPQQGLELAQVIQKLPGLRLRGILGHQSTEPLFHREDRVITGRPMVQKALDVRDALEGAGIPVEILSEGETWTYDVSAEMPGITDVQGGTYAIMETYHSYMSEFQFAGKILGTVISTPRPGVAIGDVGMKAMGAPNGMPAVEGLPGVTVKELHPEHTLLQVEGGVQLQVGDKFSLISSQQDITVSRWDQFVAVRKGKVEVVWDITARGCHH